MEQSSLKWLSGSSRRDKRLAWRSQGQLQTRLRFCRKLEVKRIRNALICGAFCDINKSFIKSVWNYTKRYRRPFFLILWTSFTPQVMKMLILPAPPPPPTTPWQFGQCKEDLRFIIKFTVNTPRNKLAQTCNPPRLYSQDKSFIQS